MIAAKSKVEPKIYSVRVPVSESPKVMLEIVKGVGRYFFSKPTTKNDKLTGEKVRAFFRSRSSSDSFADFTESTTSWYIDILNKSSFVQKTVELR